MKHFYFYPRSLKKFTIENKANRYKLIFTMPKLSENTNLVAPKDLLFQELSDGESVFLNMDNETYYGLDSVGTDMWKALTDSNSIEDAFKKLADEYKIDKTTLKQDLDELVAKFLKNGLVKIAENER